MFIGWDWGNGAHDVAVMDNDGRLVDKWKVTHTEEGLAAALRRLAKHEDPTKLPVAIEASRGLVVDRLLAAGHPVVPVDTRALDRHSYAHLFADLPRIGVANFGQILGEVGPMLERGATADQLACEVGMAPVTKESGSVRNVGFRRAVNLKARQAFVVFVNNSRFDNLWAAQLYRAARDRGKRHPHAARILGRAWLRVIHACWRNHLPYDPNRHQRSAHEACVGATT